MVFTMPYFLLFNALLYIFTYLFSPPPLCHPPFPPIFLSTRPISVNFGSRMPGWFDIDHLDEDSLAKMMKGHRGFDPEGTDESIDYVNNLIKEEVDGGIPYDRILVGGFSQGGHIALRTALEHNPKLAGCVAMSTWLEPSPFDVSSS